nr:MAG TPA: apelin receptor protein [Caudoviricetes sp.]
MFFFLYNRYKLKPITHFSSYIIAFIMGLSLNLLAI